MKTTKNLILSLMMVVLCLCFASTTVFAATMTCDEAEEILNRDNGQSSTYWLCYNDPVVVGGRESVACRTAMAKHQEAEAKKKACDAPAVCPYTSPFNFNTLGNAYKVDNSPYQVWIKTLKSNGDYVFCIEPETAFVSCSDYHAGGNIPEWARIEVSMVVNAFKQSPTTDHYIAAQMHIWEVMGSYRTVNGLDKWAYGFGDLQNLMSYGDSHEYYSVSLAEDMYYLDLGESVNNNDNNAQMHNDYFHVAASAGAAATKDGNKVVASMTEIYPLEKNINVNSTKETETSGGDIHGGTVYASSSIRSQTMFSFNGSINTIKYKHFSGDSFKIKTNTGDLKVHKVDEWGDTVNEGTTFR
ncbi:MAG: hypothetical protein J6K75_04820, partial [Erysipelotrichaceae bacterium]|nr:hypothetical protein [Erysipelotrichaceae bacterium]